MDNRTASFLFSIPPVLAECVMQIEWQIFQKYVYSEELNLFLERIGIV